MFFSLCLSRTNNIEYLIRIESKQIHSRITGNAAQNIGVLINAWVFFPSSQASLVQRWVKGRTNIHNMISESRWMENSQHRL